jgi:hypothetical protein
VGEGGERSAAPASMLSATVTIAAAIPLIPLPDMPRMLRRVMGSIRSLKELCVNLGDDV